MIDLGNLEANQQMPTQEPTQSSSDTALGIPCWIWLDSTGRVVEASVAESSGDLRKDQAFEQMALFFRYRWTPSEAVSETVQLIQPLSVEQAAVPFEIRMDPSEEEKGDQAALTDGRNP